MNDLSLQRQKLSRRRFLTSAAAAVPGLALLGHSSIIDTAFAAPQTGRNSDSFIFPLLGDLHFDRLEHHDMAWMEKEYPNDIRQVQNYSRITAEALPLLMKTVQGSIQQHRQAGRTVPFVVQLGDFVEGVCGSHELDAKHKNDAIAFVREQQLDAPFLFCKGNHDVTGPGSKETYNEIFLPFLAGEINRVHQQTQAAPVASLNSASFAVRYGDSLLAFFDAYKHPDSLDWLEATLAANTARHVFVMIHPPVTPYGARTTWHLYARERQTAERTRLLELLGKHNAIVLTGHLHKYNLMTRRTTQGRFLQLAVNSVISKPTVNVEDVLEGTAAYTPDQVRVEPRFSPDNEELRRTNISNEAPFVDYFEYASIPGYAEIEVHGEQVLMRHYRGATRELWKTRDLTAILKGQAV